MRILAICPSIYPDKLSKMMDSFMSTKSENTEIIINNEIKSITSVFNEEFQKRSDYDYYFMCNDDLVFNTELWDTKLANKGKISWGFDGIQNNGLCCFPMIDGDIIRSTGWLQLPSLNRYNGDIVWYFIGKQCEILNYVPEVSITHKWDGCSHPDDNIKDMASFAEWLPWSYRDIKRIKEILNG